MLEKIIKRMVMSTKYYQDLRDRQNKLEKDIKRISKERDRYKTIIKTIRLIFKGYTHKIKKDLLEDISNVVKKCKGI